MPRNETSKLLQRIDSSSGVYRWYRLDLLKDSSLFETSTVVMTWGRIGQDNGRSSMKTFYSSDAAESFFGAKLSQRLRRGYREVPVVEVPSDQNCALCKLIQERKKEPRVIFDFPNSVLLLNRDQTYQGRSILVFKKHIPNFFRLAPNEVLKLYSEIRLSENALREAFHPVLMNHLFMGNTAGHVHLHLVPRYESDPNFGESPFLYTRSTMKERHTKDEYAELVSKIRSYVRGPRASQQGKDSQESDSLDVLSL